MSVMKDAHDRLERWLALAQALAGCAFSLRADCLLFAVGSPNDDFLLAAGDVAVIVGAVQSARAVVVVGSDGRVGTFRAHAWLDELVPL